MSRFVRAPTKGSLISLLKDPSRMGTPEWRRIFDGVMFKDEFNRIMTGQTISGGSSAGSTPLLSGYLKRDGSTSLTGDWNAGGYTITVGTLETNTINEELSGSGVTIDGVLMKDDDIFMYATTHPTIWLQEGGDAGDYLYLRDEGSKGEISKATASGEAIVQSDPRPLDNLGNSTYQIFRETNTAGTVAFNIYKGDKTATVNHAFYGGAGAAELCKTGGTCNIAGDCYIDSAATPSLYLRQGASVTNYGQLESQYSGSAYGVTTLYNIQNAGPSYIGFEPKATDGSGDSTLRAFRFVNTSGSVDFILFRGNNTATQAYRFECDTGNAHLSQQGGIVDMYGSAKVDTIDEHTAAAGVTIDGVLLKDDGVSAGSDTNSFVVTGSTLPLHISAHKDNAITAVGASGHGPTWNAHYPAFFGYKSRGTEASPTIVGDGDILASVLFLGYDGVDYVQGASIRARVDGTPGADDMPTSIYFGTTADGASAPTESMKLTSAGVLQIDTINENTADAGTTVEGVLLKDTSIYAGVSSPDTTAIEHFLMNDSQYQVIWTRHKNSEGAPNLYMRKARGTKAAPAAAQNGDSSFNLNGQIWDGAAWRDTGTLRLKAQTVNGALTSGRFTLLVKDTTGTSRDAIDVDENMVVDIYNKITCDTIDEHTAAAGVTIDSVLAKDNTVRCGDATNNITIGNDYGVQLNGTTTVWEDLRVTVNSVRVPASGGPGWNSFKDNGAASTGTQLLWFDPGTEESVYFSIQLPHGWKEGSDIEPHVHWVSADTAGASGTDVCWGLEYTWANINATFGNTTLIYGDTQSNGSGETITVDKHYYTDIGSISGSGKTLSSMLVCRLFRDATGAGGTDDYDDDAGLLEIDFHYQIDTMGSRTETAA